VKFEIWDTAGQENILFISTMFSNICLLIQLDLELKSRVLNFSIFVVHDSGY
jgi:GTPase SAR1 family protein